MSEWNFVIAAYTVAWVGLVAYAARLVLVTRRARALEAGTDGAA